MERGTKIVAADSENADQFGSDVSIDNDYAIIASGDKSLYNAGSAYIFERSESGIWNQVQKIVAFDRAYGDSFGFSVSISGNYAIIGAPNEDYSYLDDAGSAYIFGGNKDRIWNHLQKIVPSDRNSDARFGSSVSMSGNNLIVGARQESYDVSEKIIRTWAGAVYFNKSSTSFIHEDYLQPNLVIYPNPLIDNVEIKLSDGTEIQKIVIIDIYGRIVETIDNINNNSQIIHCGTLKSGLYFIKIYSKQIYIEEVVVK